MHKLFGATMIVAGTSIGIGMLTLPALIAGSGILYGSLAIIIVWFFMWGAAKALAELSWNLPLGTNMLTMSEITLGLLGKFIMCTCYILLLYALSAAYLSSLSAISKYLYPFTSEFAVYVWSLLLLFIIMARFAALDLLNRFLMLLMGTSFLALIIGLSLLPKHVDHLLLLGSKNTAISAITILVTSFGYQIVVPSLHKKLGNDNPALLKKALFWGSIIPLVFYLLWVFIMMQQLDQATFSAMLSSGQPVAMLPAYMAKVLRAHWVQPICLTLVVSAIMTSWFGVSISILDFFKDSKLEKQAILLTIIPPLLFAKFYPNGFLLALQYSGYLVALLLIMLPTIMLIVWQNKNISKHIFIRKSILFLVLFFGIFVLFL